MANRKGNRHSAETLAKMRAARKGKKPNLNKRHSPETRARMSAARLRYYQEHPEMKAVAGSATRGKPGVNRGRKWSAEVRAKMSASHSGPRCHLWRGGVSFMPYTTDWTQSLKRSIRERDRYTCQACGAQQGDVAFDVHHIDFDKANSNPSNLITLCHRCHAKTTIKRRHWTELLEDR